MRLRPLALAILAGLCGTAAAADPAAAQALHGKHCISCHDASVYTRDNRRVTSRAGLETQVRRCDQALGLRLFDDEIGGLAAFLDQHYYKFR